MITFLLSIVALVVGYFVYGVFVEKVFGIEPNRVTPAKEFSDGVDYVEMSKWKAFLIQFLNIAGTGPIFGAIAGAMWGPAAFMWIVFGCIFAGATHDFLVGMMSVRSKGQSISEIIGDNLGNTAKQFIRVFSLILLVLVGVVFISSPADILKEITGISREILLGIIIVYYILATVLPIDKIIGKIYPLFGFALLFMAVGIAFMLITGNYQIPEFSFTNMHPAGKPIFPYLFISIACGAISGFHATQSPMIARCMRNEKEGRMIFYGAMISEGVVALIWAAAAMSFFGGVSGLGQYLGTAGNTAATAVNKISTTLLGSIGGVFAVLGVVAAPISSGDTAFRSARLTIADITGLKQGPIKNRFLIALPLFAIGVVLTFVDFEIIWRYFGWANQTLATFALWAATVYLFNKQKNYWIALIPSIFMTAVITCYFVVAPEGFGKLLPKENAILIGTVIGLIACVITTIGFFMYTKKKAFKK